MTAGVCSNAVAGAPPPLPTSLREESGRRRAAPSARRRSAAAVALAGSACSGSAACCASWRPEGLGEASRKLLGGFRSSLGLTLGPSRGGVLKNKAARLNVELQEYLPV